MTAVVQPDLGPPPAHKYKDDPSDDSLRHLGSNHPQSLQQHSRPGGLLQQHNQRPDSPHQHSGGALASNPYSTGPGLNGLSLQHPPQPQYPPSAQDPYYASHTNPYPAVTTPHYPSSGPPDLMAATAQMQRPYPPIYQTTPQSNSPTSVASSQTHDQHGRSLYAQSPQMPSQMYGYQPYSPINPVHPAYNSQPPAPQHPLTTQSLMMPPQTAPVQHTVPSTHQQAMGNPTMNNTNSPRLKVDPLPQHNTPIQNHRPAPPPPPMSTPALASPNTPVQPLSANSVHGNHPAGVNSTNAAPGPIPATTPQLVRQDSNGVQWIAFEYSRDRVKMEYTIRCDVESVNVEALSADFKTENCVYPRACCSKDQYRGNRLVYETECNAVGWALAELNPPLRGKRGLIQRAVDSWRNSNQDPRLRSRRVRRMAKMNRRQASQTPNHQLGPNTSVPHLLTQSASGHAQNPRPPTAPLTLAAPPLQHHAHHADGQAGNEEVSGSTEFSNGAHRSPYVPHNAKASIIGAHEPTPDLRTGQVYHGMLPYPATAHVPGGLGTPSMAPLQGGGFESIGRHSVATAASQGQDIDDSYETEATTAKPGDKVLFGNLPASKRRKFILVDDHQRGGRARVKVTLDRVNMNEIPDSYRLANAVFPRAYYPIQMRGSPGHSVPDSRYLEDNDADDYNDDDDENYDFDNGNEPVTVGRTIVNVPTVEGLSAPVPQLSRSRHRKDKIINDFGYRMSWSQSRVFSGRHLFLQRSLDAYRNKMRGSMLTIGQEPESIPSHFETRIGKRKFNSRIQRRRNDGSSLTATRREAEETAA